MVMKRKKVVRTEGIEIPEGNTEDLKESYKYLQVPQENVNHKEADRKAATTKYLRREIEATDINTMKLVHHAWRVSPQIWHPETPFLIMSFSLFSYYVNFIFLIFSTAGATSSSHLIL